MSTDRDSIGTNFTTGTALTGVSEGRGKKSLRSATSLGKQFKRNTSTIPYAIDAEAEGLANAVDTTDDHLSTLELGKKYSQIFGEVQFVFANMTGTMFEDLQEPLKPFDGSLQAYNVLKDQGLVVLITNTWKTSKQSIVDLLNSENFNVEENDIFTSSDACKNYLKEKGLQRPYYLASPAALEDFTAEFPSGPDEDVVVVGLPSTQFDYRLLSKGINLLQEGKPLVALNLMKSCITANVRNTNLGPGPFITMLSACTDSEPIAVCKPSIMFYEQLCKKVGCTDYSKAVVIGDDIREDIAGAKSLGMKAILTRTGNYRANDEKLLCAGLAPDATAENFAMAARCVLASAAVSQMTETDIIEEDRTSKACGGLVEASTNEDVLSRKIKAYVAADYKSTRSEAGKNAIRLPSYIW